MPALTLLPGVYFARRPNALHVYSDTPLTVLSSAVLGGELTAARHILNLHVSDRYHHPAPAEDLRRQGRALGIDEPFVGLMTAARLEHAQVFCQEAAGATVAAIFTVGLSHPTAAGLSQPGPAPLPPGTINGIVIVDGILTPAARVNAVITATEAKSLTLMEAGVRTQEGQPATGTGTDALVIANTGRGLSFEYAGPVAPLGALIAQTVRQAIRRALTLRNLFNRPLASGQSRLTGRSGDGADRLHPSRL